jgi:hypothetical protein
MVPNVGSFCEFCALGAHYSLTCRACGHTWEEPSFPCELICPHCGCMFEVTLADHAAFTELAVGQTAGPLVKARRPSGVWGWAEQAYASRRHTG